MFKEIEGLPADVLAVEAIGKATHADDRDWFIPGSEAMVGQGPVGMLYVIGKDFTGYAPRAMADDAGFGLSHLHDFRQIAVVSDHPGLNTMISPCKPIFHDEVRVFRLADLDQARGWIMAGSSHG